MLMMKRTFKIKVWELLLLLLLKAAMKTKILDIQGEQVKSVRHFV